MFKPQPLRHAAAFTGGTFCISLAITLAKFLHLPASFSAALWLCLTIAFVSAALAGAIFWLGLGFSHREPIPRSAAMIGAVSYCLNFNILSLFGTSSAVQLFSFALFIALPFFFGSRWPARASAHYSPKQTAED
jgi:hypothetical protein